MVQLADGSMFAVNLAVADMAQRSKVRGFVVAAIRQGYLVMDMQFSHQPAKTMWVTARCTSVVVALKYKSTALIPVGGI